MAAPGKSLSNKKSQSELMPRLGFLLMAILVYRLGTHVPVPGLNFEVVSDFFKQQSETILGLFNMFSGGALERMSILALGIMPYISASIIMQLLGAVSPSLEQLKKEGDAGRRKMSQYTRYLTIALAIVQAFFVTQGLASQENFVDSEAFPGMTFHFVATVSLVTGAVFMMWLGEQITERGIGNGISMLIFAGIVAGIIPAIGGAFTSAQTSSTGIFAVLFMLVFAVAIIWFVVFIERGQRQITVNYAKRQQGRKVFAAQTSHLPLKVNMAGVIPAIFASSLLLFPASISQFFGDGSSEGVMQLITAALGQGQPLQIVVFTALIVFFCFFYTALMFNPNEVADNLKKSGAYIPGIRPGEQSAKYIDSVLTRLTVIGSIYMAGICLIPQVLTNIPNISTLANYLGGTSLLIVVVVLMDFMAQVQSHAMSQQYDSLMKKSNLKGNSAGR